VACQKFGAHSERSPICRQDANFGTSQVGHLLGEPALDRGCLGELGGVGIVGAGDPEALLDRDEPAAGHDPAMPPERPPVSIDAELVLVGEEQLEVRSEGGRAARGC
jgi:hypothetical protein